MAMIPFNIDHISLINLLLAITHTSTSHISLVHHLPAITPTSIGLGKDLSQLAKTYTNKIIYSGWNNSFIL